MNQYQKLTKEDIEKIVPDVIKAYIEVIVTAKLAEASKPSLNQCKEKTRDGTQCLNVMKIGEYCRLHTKMKHGRKN